MDLSSQGFCCRTMKKLRDSPIGTFCINNINEYSDVLRSDITFDKIDEKLRNYKYSSIKDWYSDLRKMLIHTSKAAASRTDFGLVCQTLLQMAEEDIAKIGMGYIIPNNSVKSIDKIMKSMKKICKKLPDSKETFKDSIEELEPVVPNPYNPNRNKYPSFNSDDIADLYRELYDIETDEEVKAVLKVASTFEKVPVTKKTFATLDLNVMSPFTLSIIKKQIKKGVEPKRK